MSDDHNIRKQPENSTFGKGPPPTIGYPEISWTSTSQNFLDEDIPKTFGPGYPKILILSKTISFIFNVAALKKSQLPPSGEFSLQYTLQDLLTLDKRGWRGDGQKCWQMPHSC